MSDAPERIWAFDRYVNGVLMAEGVEITRAASFEDACVSAARLASRGPNGEAPVLILASSAALAASPEVQALIREAEARGRRHGLELAASTGYRVCAETRHVSLGHKVEAAIRAEAAALRKEETPK